MSALSGLQSKGIAECFQEKIPNGYTYCCAVCLHWYQSREEKDICMGMHGYTVVDILQGKS